MNVIKNYRHFVIFALISGAMFLFLGCKAKKDYEIKNLVVREPVPGRSMTAGYFTLENLGEQNLVLNYVHSPIADVIEVHRHVYERGMMRMREVKHLTLDPKTRLDFKPGGHHLMLMGLSDELEADQEVPVTFEFENHPPHTMVAKIKRL